MDSLLSFLSLTSKIANRYIKRKLESRSKLEVYMSFYTLDGMSISHAFAGRTLQRIKSQSWNSTPWTNPLLKVGAFKSEEGLLDPASIILPQGMLRLS
jgi:hypothetical protein